MKQGGRKTTVFAAAALALLGSFCVAARIPSGAGGKTAAAAAGFILPAGNTDGFFSEEEEDGTGVPSPVSSSLPVKPGGSSSGTASLPPQSSLPSSAAPVENGKVLELSVGNAGTQVGNFWVKNSTDKHKDIDFTKELAQAPAVKIQSSTTAPQVLIYHTHTTESYDCLARSTDLTKSVCAVGDKIAEQLQAAGIGVLHDKKVHDYPAYDGSYDRSIVTMQNDIKKYPGIQVTLDIHRDAMHRDDGTMLKTTSVVGGRKAAQLMILAGCDDDGTLGFPNWECNLRLALRLQKALAEDAPGLARPIDFCARRYNENVTKGSLLIEIGTDANTLDEAEYSGSLLGKSLARVLGSLT
ncbi:MAG TPA: stage II sporulation protein P [Armatimonadota bacterium]|nr:stage II sporulation protein P [Armatimonadota bacterium]